MALLCAVALAMALTGAGCLSTPISGRRQVVAIPEAEEIRLGEETWRQILAEAKESTNHEYVQLVNRVGRRIAAVSGRSDFAWDFRVLESDELNAFALPGGKVAVHEGIFRVCENEAGLAVVLSHEIAHALARHGGERMTQQGVVSSVGGVIDRIAGRDNEQQRKRWAEAYGAVSEYGILRPYSRVHEAEADSIGLTLMAKAGYDPREAPRFWERFGRMTGPQPPELLSTHPSNETRAQHLASLLPQALALYEAAPEKLGVGVAVALPSTFDESVQLAEFEAAEQKSRIDQAALSDQFLPPIRRERTGSVGATGAAFADAPSPRPFPTTSPDDEKWRAVNQ